MEEEYERGTECLEAGEPTTQGSKYDFDKGERTVEGMLSSFIFFVLVLKGTPIHISKDFACLRDNENLRPLFRSMSSLNIY